MTPPPPPPSTSSGVAKLPPLPPDGFFTKDQWRVLDAICDGVLPSITSESAAFNKASQITLPDPELDRVLDEAVRPLAPPATKQAIRSFLEERLSEDARFKHNVLRTLDFLPPDKKSKLANFLGLMATRPGSWLLTGYWQPIYNQPAHVREAIVQSWANSTRVTFRGLAKTFSSMASKAVLQSNPLIKQISGYADIPEGWTAQTGPDYKFLQFVADSEPQTVEADIVIVGSGPGGAISAKNLAEAGHKVLVVDKGHHFPPSQLPMPQEEACQHLFENGGLYLSDDDSVTVVAGSNWGGGGTVNWSVCLKLQDFVRKEWAAEGLPFFASAEFDECEDRVWEYQGAGTDGITHNHRNQVLLKGAAKMGWAAHEAPQNTAGKKHYCGQCHLGCGMAEKRGPAISYLPDAAQAGAEFIEGFHVDKVLFDEHGTTAIGVEGEWTSRDAAGGVGGPDSERIKRRVIVKAKKVIVAAGALQSPLVLMKSGIENSNLGSNLHLHPCHFITAVYKDEVRPWEGGIITSYSPEFENLDGSGYGVKLETTSMVPYATLSMLPWTSGLNAKLNMAKYRHTDGWISVTRDRDTGRVYQDPKDGRPRIDYSPSDRDRAHTLQGIEALAKLCYVTGAAEIRPLLVRVEPFVRTGGEDAPAQDRLDDEGPAADPETRDPAFAAWLQHVRAVGSEPPSTMWSSAHQMGTCRMAKSAVEGVVDERGRVWGRDGLYVADASVFPGASGVNPMITVLTIADWISRRVDDDLRA